MSQLKSHPASLPWYVRLSDSLYVSLLVLTSGIWLIYSNTFRVPFLFDDESSIVKNTSLRHLGSIWRILHPTENAGVGGRPLLNLSYAINYALGGTQVVGYHIVDLVIHTIAAVLLLVLLRLIFKQILVDPKFEYYRNSLSNRTMGMASSTNNLRNLSIPASRIIDGIILSSYYFIVFSRLI